jgi:hypothetical protein
MGAGTQYSVLTDSKSRAHVAAKFQRRITLPKMLFANKQQNPGLIAKFLAETIPGMLLMLTCSKFMQFFSLDRVPPSLYNFRFFDKLHYLFLIILNGVCYYYYYDHIGMLIMELAELYFRMLILRNWTFTLLHHYRNCYSRVVVLLHLQIWWSWYLIIHSTTRYLMIHV